MRNSLIAAEQLSDAELLVEIKAAAAFERRATAQLIALLAEVDHRRLYLGEGCPSLFAYCTHVLHLSEHAAYGRIEAARAAIKFPVLLERLADGAVTMTAITLLAPPLTHENHEVVLAEARHKSKREVEHLVARLRPQPPAATVVRKVPTAVSSGCAERPLRRSSGDDRQLLAAPEHQSAVERSSAAAPETRLAVITPLAPERYKVQFTMSRETHDRLRKAQDLLRHTIPNGDPSAIIDRALTVLLEHLQRRKYAATSRPRSVRTVSHRSRYIPASVKREVWSDGAQCGFVGQEGRCPERGFLEFHHVTAHADGGPATVDNIQLRCRAHNVYEAELCGLIVRERATSYVVANRSGPSWLQDATREAGRRLATS